MAAPTFIASYGAATFGAAATPKTTSVTTLAGDMVVVYATDSFGPIAFGLPTGNGINFTQRYSDVLDEDWNDIYVWTGVDTTGGTNWTLSLAGPANGTGINWGFGCAVFRSVTGIGTVGGFHLGSPNPPSYVARTLQNSSLILFISTDHINGGGTSRVYNTINGITPTSGNGLELLYRNTSPTTYAAYYTDSGPIGNNTFGMQAPTAQKPSFMIIELRGSQEMTPLAWVI